MSGVQKIRCHHCGKLKNYYHFGGCDDTCADCVILAADEEIQVTLDEEELNRFERLYDRMMERKAERENDNGH